MQLPKNGYLRIFNQLGSLIMTAHLSKSANKTILSMANIANVMRHALATLQS